MRPRMALVHALGARERLSERHTWTVDRTVDRRVDRRVDRFYVLPYMSESLYPGDILALRAGPQGRAEEQEVEPPHRDGAHGVVVSTPVTSSSHTLSKQPEPWLTSNTSINDQDQ